MTEKMTEREELAKAIDVKNCFVQCDKPESSCPYCIARKLLSAGYRKITPELVGEIIVFGRDSNLETLTCEEIAKKVLEGLWKKV